MQSEQTHSKKRIDPKIVIQPGDITPTRVVSVAPTLLTQRGDWRAEEFQIEQRETLLFQFVSDYAALSVVLMPDQINNLRRNRMVVGFGDFNAQNGMLSVTLKPGQYLLAVRNIAEQPNQVTARLDRPLSLPLRLGLKHHDAYLHRTVSIAPYGGKYIQPFTVQAATTYFVSGCCSGLPGYLLPASELAAFADNLPFRRIAPFSNPEGACDYPNFLPLQLPLGDYAFAFQNPFETPKSVTFTLDRWAPL